MTGHQINSLVGDLVAMAQAMERLPQVEAELANANHAIALLESDKQSLWDDLEQSKNYNASLEAKVRDAEVARDDAELRFLELDEKINLANGYVESVEIVLGHLKAQLAPSVQPEPIISEVKPIDVDPTPASFPSAITHTAPAPIDPPQGQSEADPIAMPDTMEASAVSVPSVDSAMQPVPSSASPTPPDTKPKGPYTDLNWSDVYPRVYNFTTWIEGGGTAVAFNL